ncbi:hypothetical protein Q604_UNBc4C00142G0001, partial [human gut metagenome]
WIILFKKIKKNLNANLKKRIFDIIIVHSNLIRNEYYAIRNNKYFIKSNTNLGGIEESIMEFFKKYRNTILKYAFLLFLMFFTVYLVFKNLDINSIDKIKNIIDK